jgi:thiamine pyrophosphokinase
LTPALLSELVDIFTNSPVRERRTLFLLGGRRPDVTWLADFASRGDFDVWAVDSGVTACRETNLTPSVIIGDRDSAPASDWEWALGRGAAEYLHPTAKNLTDFQLALNLLQENRTANLILTGCFGGRLDHLLSVLDTFAASRSLCMIDELEGVFLIRPGMEISAVFKKKPLAVSLLSLSEECAGVSIRGVRWPLEGVALRRDYPWAVSNETADAVGQACWKVSARCESGILGFYWCFNS